MREKIPCKLSGTRTCAMLNMHSCDRCPLSMDGDQQDKIVADVETFCELLPEEGLHTLFETDECQLCKGESRGKKTGYAIVDMAHSEPTDERKRSRLFGKQRFGFLAPLQFAVCSKCRMKLLFLEYLPMIMTVLFTLIALLFVANDDQRKVLNGTSVGFALPLIIIVGALVLGYVLGKVLKMVLSNSWNKGMYVNALDHPFVKAMEEKGWFPLFDAKKGKVIFTRKQIDRGLGTAHKEAYEVLDKEGEV